MAERRDSKAGREAKAAKADKATQVAAKTARVSEAEEAPEGGRQLSKPAFGTAADSGFDTAGDPAADPSFEPASQRRFLRFAVGAQELALELGRLEEIVEPGKITRAPGAPPWLLGALNLRGQALPVLDLAIKLGLPAAADVGLRPAVLVFRTGAQAPRLGARVSGVLGFVEVDDRAIAPAPRVGGVLAPGLLAGLVSIDGRFVPWLDLSAAVSA